MLRSSILKFIFLFLTLTSATFAQQATKAYNKKGNFDLAVGFSVGSTSNYPGWQSYGISLAPYANHFIFDQVFARYDLGIRFGFSQSGSYDSTGFSLLPGLAVGYSFGLSEKLYLNMSGGYKIATGWQFTSYGGNYSDSSQYINFYPEIKYLITEKWAVALTTEIWTNIPYLIAKKTNSLAVSSQLFVTVSYIF